MFPQDKMVKYKSANEDPLYWKITIGLFIFGLLSYWLIPKFYFATLFSFIGIIIYFLISINKALKRQSKESKR